MKAFGDNNGAAVAINPKNGGILRSSASLVTTQTCSSRESAQRTTMPLQDDESRPLYNRDCVANTRRDRR